jgi:glycosyltransferase involved in cell wall biosynthesis
MKICLVSEYFYPQSKGGTEKYVHQLAKKLISEHNVVEIITSSDVNIEGYFYDDIPVKVIVLKQIQETAIISGTKPADNLEKFEDILLRGKYDTVHFHTLTPAFNLYHIKAAKEIAKKVYFTAHIPAITCIHGDLMQFGKIPCDGLILNHRCTACYLSKKSIPKNLSQLLGVGITALKYPKTIANVVKNKLIDLQNLNQLCDKIFVFTHWQYRIFIANGFNEDKINLTTQILDKEISPEKIKPNTHFSKIGFVGRLSPEKGLHILLKAFIDSGRSDLQLDIATIRDESSTRYFERLWNISKHYSNVHWNFNLAPEEMNDFYKKIDVLCIPSIWYETGPFVLYEAFENKIPVIANNLGDMGVWKKKGYPIELYAHINELTNIFRAKSGLFQVD